MFILIIYEYSIVQKKNLKKKSSAHLRGLISYFTIKPYAESKFGLDSTYKQTIYLVPSIQVLKVYLGHWTCINPALIRFGH